MYTKQEASKQRQVFWTAFGQYMRPIPSADLEKVNWVNYKTGIPGISFKMDADGTGAYIGIILSQQDMAEQQAFYSAFVRLAHILHEALGEEWQWEGGVTGEDGKTISLISTRLDDVSIYRTDDWPQLISFFKQRIIALDAFWSMARYSFEHL